MKPQNVLVTAGGRVTILDFGLVSDASRADSGTAMVFGTPEYMAPEQAAGRAVSEASDWYSFGVMLYEALTGELPFLGSFQAILRDKQTIDPIQASRFRRDAPADLFGLAEALLRRDPSLRPTGEQVLHDVGATAAEPIRVSSRDRTQFLGRDHELAALRRALDAAKEGKLTTVFVHGPSGVGKSALISHFLDEVRKQKTYLVLEGCCHERESVPYKALDSLIDNLNQLLLDLPRAERRAMLPDDFGALARLFPVLEGLMEGLEPMHMPNLAELRLRGFAVLRELLARVAARQPVVLAIDDLQWGDTDSAVPLLDLMNGPDPAPILFLACYRSDEADTSPLLRLLFRDRGARVFRDSLKLLVEPLAEGFGRDLACLLLRQRGQESIVLSEEIVRESGGNPFFIRELVEHWAAETDPGVRSRKPLPGAAAVSIDELVRRRIERLPEEVRRLMEVIALAGQPIGLAIARTAARVETSAYTALAGLRAQHLIRIRSTETSEEIEPYHDRIRQTAESSLSSEALRECHYRLATAWESAGPSDPRFLALHFRQAMVADKAFEYSTRAANEAAAALAFESAAQFYRFALEFALDDGQLDAVSVQLGEALCNAGRGVEGAQVYLTVAAGRQAADSLELRRRAAAHLLMAGRIEGGLALVQQLLQGFGMRVARSKTGALFSFLLRRLWIRVRGLRFQLRAASEIPEEELLRLDTVASLMQGLAMVDPALASPFHARTLTLALHAGEPRRISFALCGDAGYLAMQGCKVSRVERVLQRTQELADFSDSQNGMGMVKLSKGVAAFLRGDWKQAEEYMMLAEVTLRERCIGVAWEVATAHMMGNVALFQMGEIKLLKQRLPRIIQDAEVRGDLFEVTNLRTRLAHVLCLAADNPERAHEEIRAAMAVWQRKQFDLQRWWGWIGSIETDLYAGDAGSAWLQIGQ